MSAWKFETKLLNGKPSISFENEKMKAGKKLVNYKSKAQRNPQKPTNQSGISHDFHQPNHNNNLETGFNKKGKSNDRHIENKNNIRNHSNTTQSSSNGKESLFNFLKTDPGEKSQQYPQRRPPQQWSNERKVSDKSVEKESKVNVPPLTDNDIDELMKHVIKENRDLLTEDQLVELLAKLYVEAKLKEKEVLKGRHEQTVEKEGIGESEWTLDEKERQYYKDRQTEKSMKDRLGKIDGYGSTSRNPVESLELMTSTATSKVMVTPLTTMQKKQLQWEKERKEMASIVDYNPWGKPGCGAPTKSFLDTGAVALSPIGGGGGGTTQKKSIPGMVYDSKTQMVMNNANGLTFAGSSSTNHNFISDVSQNERKRQQWLAELNEQVIEKERRKLLELESRRNNPSETVATKSLIKPLAEEETNLLGHGRGKGLADLSQISSDEMIKKRCKQLEQQEAIKRQIEEKEYQKRLDREKKALLDQQEENRVLREKQQLDTQYLSETARIKQRDDESGKRFAQQKHQIEAAEKAALLDKKLKRLQRLEMAGHDTKQLRAVLMEDQASLQIVRDSFDVKSDDNSLAQNVNIDRTLDNMYTIRSPRGLKQLTSTEEHGVQTENNNFLEGQRQRDYRNYDKYANNVRYVSHASDTPRTDIHNKRAHEHSNRKGVKINSAKRRPSSVVSQNQKKPDSIESRKPWGAKKVAKKYVSQSKRDPFYSTFQEARELQKQERVNRILAQVKANQDRIPDKDVNEGRISQRHKRCESNRRYENDKENYEIKQDTYDLKDNNSNNFVPDAEDDRVNAPVTYRDTYKQPSKSNQTYKIGMESQTGTNRKENGSPNDWSIDQNHEIVRTTDILNPANADLRLPISRENTGRERARKGYYKNQNPAQYGDPISASSSDYVQNGKDADNKRETFYHPQGHPTERQNIILKQLSHFREGLLMKQKEIETSLSMNEDL